MTAILITIPVRKFATGYPKSHYDAMELERQYLDIVQDLPIGATLRLSVGSMPPIPEFLGWHRSGLNYQISAADAVTAAAWQSMLVAHFRKLMVGGDAA